MKWKKDKKGMDQEIERLAQRARKQGNLREALVLFTLAGCSATQGGGLDDLVIAAQEVAEKGMLRAVYG